MIARPTARANKAQPKTIIGKSRPIMNSTYRSILLLARFRRAVVWETAAGLRRECLHLTARPEIRPEPSESRGIGRPTGTILTTPARGRPVRPQPIGPLLRTLTQAQQSASDTELLGRIAASRDPDAFTALVERHGRLVWAVCRHLAGPDADDAFQATFLVLFRNAGRIRKPRSLAPWLHGVAYRVSVRARRSARRRTDRERAAAIPDRATVVPDSAWDRALAAVHEEVALLPEILRLPFVLCVLEGRSVTEAAGQLGWKVSTLSARLGRAKETLLTRLQSRGLTTAAVVAVAIATEVVPAAIANAAASVANVGSVSGKIQVLTQGVVGMSASQMKLLAAGVLLAVGLGVGGGAGWLATAEAQAPSRPPETAEERVRRLQAQLDQAKKELADKQEADRRMSARSAPLSTAYWQYAFVPVRDVDAEGFVKLLGEREADGWDYSGQTTLKKEAVWAFRRPAKNRIRTYETNPDRNLFPSAPGSSSGAANPLDRFPPLEPGTKPPADTTTPK
jgi:RNA polymerase sigma factor (sigma-70 family)